jgi:predicted DCC family thiol-disulfide oxidoreductase YuxK
VEKTFVPSRSLSSNNSPVQSVRQVSSPPAKPLMIYDGDCRFCALWVHRWQHVTGDQVEYHPYPHPGIAIRFPEIPHEQFERSVQFIQPDGQVFGGAEAVFRALALNPDTTWPLDWYQHWPVFVRLSETSYRFIATHRGLFSVLTRMLWGRDIGPPTHALVRWLFLRGLGLVYLIAFLSFWAQINGLVGSDGILPAKLTMESAARQLHMGGLARYHLFPTLCWLGASDGSLHWQCAAGSGLAALLIAGVAPVPCLFLLWLIYLSLTTVGGVFIGYQWDNLLLEAGFLAIFFAPMQLWPKRPSRQKPPSRLALWLLRWLVFRLMFESGCVKLLSGDPHWRNLTALRFHFETQPLPTWIGWYVHQLPLGFLKGDAVVMFAIELVAPFLIFAPRRPRHLAFGCFALLQLFILLTGNYGFFNLLTLVLCLTLLDDAALARHLPGRRRFTAPESCPTPISLPSPSTPSSAKVADGVENQNNVGEEPGAVRAGGSDRATPVAVRRAHWPGLVVWPLTAVVLCTSLVQLLALFRVPIPGPGPLITLDRWLIPFRSFNSYGLFAVMTTTRPEIIIEGSDDGTNWKEYEFKYKPGDVRSRPRFVAPYQPRLDWQMWFAALSDYRHNPWFLNFCVRLLQDSPDVRALLKQAPFPDHSPRYIRAALYEYRFTDFATRRRTGAWWERERIGLYLPPLSLREDINPPYRTPNVRNLRDPQIAGP